MNKRFLNLTIIGCLLWQTVLSAAAQTSNVRYIVEDLGALGANQNNASYAYAINSVGQVVGTAQADAGGFFPFRWTDGVMQNLGSLGGVNDRSFAAGATDINDFGLVTGSLKTADNKTHAFLYDGSRLIDLGGGGSEFPNSADHTEGKSINNRGEIVGSQGIFPNVNGFFYNGAELRNINALIPPGSGWRIVQATDINDARQIVGIGFNRTSSSYRSFRYQIGGDLTNIEPTETGHAYANAINRLQKTVGTNSADMYALAFFHTDATGTVRLRALNFQAQTGANGINTRGTIVGSSVILLPPPMGNALAVVWLSPNDVRDLNNLIAPGQGWTLQVARAINDRGQIVGFGKRLINGVEVDRAFRLTPIRPENNQISDFDGDGKTDVAVYRGGNWYVSRSSNNGFDSVPFGISTDRLTPGDYDGDGKTDFAVFRDGTWFILNSGNGSFRSVQFGLPNDVPTAGDFDADGKTDIAVFRPSNGFWYVLRSGDNSFSGQQFGQAGDKPVVGDYDADGRADLAVFRPANGVWYVLQSTLGFRAVQWGIQSDRPVQGDYDGDGKTDFAVYRPENGTWYLLRSQNGFAAAQFGISSDEPAPGDFDGDGKIDLAVYRGGTWYVRQSQAGFRAVPFGIAGDKPISAAYNPPTGN